MTNKSVYETPEKISENKRHILTVLVDNEPGVLARVIGMFSGRGYNIDSLNVAEVSNDEHLSRITIVTEGTSEVVNQIEKQLLRIVPVHSVTNLNQEGSAVEAEVALVYIEVNESNKKKIYEICDFYRARKIENEHNAIIFEIAGASERINRFIKEVDEITSIEIVRSGPVAIFTHQKKEEE
ncbi:MAG: Acetolactate synthase isozyme 3 small subunit [Alphaproteobacteria bacterium MarineAlpha5_Bin5]|nr:MAG: Acetolactate synthase isozyme 3 small subunit [Alphaproteobacteria bacterium MarineAlpha5_Bin5]PPR52053.1 MAG: Acetolactate synthase isozyme 3 small subunit [Alphaproteobacteria bacterium MarineAlpha5_Bin4]|tara:strand:- start:599 stop:1144 length:546 start_codon:yes stop_codon:yes gene_type:complete